MCCVIRVEDRIVRAVCREYFDCVSEQESLQLYADRSITYPRGYIAVCWISCPRIVSKFYLSVA